MKFIFGRLKILPTISTRFLVSVIFLVKIIENLQQNILCLNFFFLAKMAKNHHLGASQVPPLVKELIGQLCCVPCPKEGKSTKKCLHFASSFVATFVFLYLASHTLLPDRMPARWVFTHGNQ